MTEDTISRQAAIDRAVSIPMFGRDVKMVAVSEIKNLPSVQPEIIRCEDCEYYKTKQRHLPWKNSRRYCNRSVILAMNPDDFCSRAERRKQQGSARWRT